MAHSCSPYPDTLAPGTRVQLSRAGCQLVMETSSDRAGSQTISSENSRLVVQLVTDEFKLFLVISCFMEKVIVCGLSGVKYPYHFEKHMGP